MNTLPHLKRCVAALQLAALAALGTTPFVATAADAFPARSLTLWVPFPPAGSTDVIARAVAQGMARHLGQAITVDNKAGAGGTLGALQVIRAAPDGHTLLLGGPADQVNAPFMMAKAPYDAGRDLEPVGCILRSPNLLVVHPSVAANSVQELIRLAKAEPGKLNFASAGNGNTSHLSGELLAQLAGIQITHVPYRGNAPAITDTLGGQTQMMFSSPLSVIQHVKSGALRAIAVAAPARMAALPNVPTLREAGINMDIGAFACVMAPAKTPVDVLDKLHAALAKTLDEPAVLQMIDTTGGEKFSTSREEARRFLAQERETWGNLIRTRRIRAE